jgi:hypothetical protein
MVHKLKALDIEQMLDVSPGAGEEVVDAEDLRAIGKYAVAQVRTEKAGAAGYERSPGDVVTHD